MSNLIDKSLVMQAFRTTLADAQVGTHDTTSENIAFRDGEAIPVNVTVTLPATRILDPVTDLSVIERPFDPNGKTLWFKESFMPAMETSTANTVNMLAGIYRISVYVPSTDGASSNIKKLNTYTKYVQEVFSPEKDVIALTESGSDGITIDSCSLVSLPKEEEWLSAAVDVEFRVYRKETL